MKKQITTLLTLLVLLSSTWISAEEINVKVAGDRTAVMQVTDSNAGDPDVSGTFNGSADLKSGKSALKGDLVINDAAELQGAKAGFYSKMTGKTIEAIGFMEAKIPADPSAPTILDIKAEAVTDGDQSAANFNVNVVAPKTDDSVPTGSGSAKAEGDFKALNTSGDFAFSGGDIKAEEVPFKNFLITIIEAENKTTVSFEIKVAKDSPMAGQLDQIPAMAPMLEQNLKQANVAFEGLDFPAPKEEGEFKVGSGSITLVDLRGTIRPFLGFAAGSLQAEMGPDVDVQGALESMLEVKFDKFTFSMNVEAEKLNGSFEANVSSLDKFYSGYLVLLPAIQKQSNQEMAQEFDDFGPLFIAFMDLNSEQAVKAMKAALESNMKLTGDVKFALEPKDEDMSFTASGNLLTTGYQDYLAKAKAAGLPVAEKAVAHLDVSLKEGTALVGDMYLYTDGDLVSYYKGMLSNAAQSSGAPQDVVDAINALDLNQLAMKMDLQGNKIALEGTGDTSDLTAVTKIILQKAAPQIEATLTGANVAIEMPAAGSDAEGKADVNIYFSDFMPGKNEAQIKESFGLPASATITLDASADDTKLVAVAQPELAIDGQLAEVQSKGQKLLASSPADMGGEGGGGSKTGFIALGALLVLGVAGFLMFGKKS